MAELPASRKGPFKVLVVNLNRAQPVSSYNQLSRCRHGLGRTWSFAKDGRQSERRSWEWRPNQGSNYHDGQGKPSCYRGRVMTRGGWGPWKVAGSTDWSSLDPWSVVGVMVPEEVSWRDGRRRPDRESLKMETVSYSSSPQNPIYRKAFNR